MSKIARIISSSAKWYEPIIDEKDMKEHEVDDSWIDKNYTRRDFYIAQDPSGEEIGTISMQYFGNTTYLGYIYVHAEKTGNGYGKKLIKFAEEQAKEKGQESLILIAHPKATWATKAYERYGFKKKFDSKEKVLNYKEGLLEPYYEEGFHLYEYRL